MKSPSLVMVKLNWLQRIWWAWMIGVLCLTMPQEGEEVPSK